MKPSKELREKILFSIKEEEISRAKNYSFLALAAACISVGGLIFSVQYLIGEFDQSSFHQYVSLIFSDPGIAAVYWKELSLSLIETVPILGITISLSALWAFLASLRTLVKNPRGGLLLSFNK